MRRGTETDSPAAREKAAQSSRPSARSDVASAISPASYVAHVPSFAAKSSGTASAGAGAAAQARQSLAPASWKTRTGVASVWFRSAESPGGLT